MPLLDDDADASVYSRCCRIKTRPCRLADRLERLTTTPIRSLELMLDAIIPYALNGHVQASLILLLVVLPYDVVLAVATLRLRKRLD